MNADRRSFKTTVILGLLAALAWFGVTSTPHSENPSVTIRHHLGAIRVDNPSDRGPADGLRVLGFLAVAMVCSLLCLRGCWPESKSARAVLSRGTLAIGALLATLLILETFLEWQARQIDWAACKPPPSAMMPLTMPDAWGLKQIEVGPPSSFRWQGVTHQFDGNLLRNASPIAPKRDGAFRILCFGDSFTYGYGLPRDAAYPNVLQKVLSEEFHVEVLNMGVFTSNSSDIRGIIAATLKAESASPDVPFDPDLLVYGVCLNDFQPDDAPPDTQPDLLPAAFQPLLRWLTDRTRVFRLLSERTSDAMISVGLRESFTTAIDTNFDERRARFARDAVEMNQAALDHGLPPIVGMVLVHDPREGSHQNELVQIAEQILEESGLSVLPMKEFLDKHDGRVMRINRWESHPNVEAQRLFAAELANAIRLRPDIQSFRK